MCSKKEMDTKQHTHKNENEKLPSLQKQTRATLLYRMSTVQCFPTEVGE